MIYVLLLLWKSVFNENDKYSSFKYKLEHSDYIFLTLLKKSIHHYNYVVYALMTLCKLCRLNDIENEYHFLCVCPLYNNRRKIVFEEVKLKHVHFHTLSLSDKLIFVMKLLHSCHPKIMTAFLKTYMIFHSACVFQLIM